MQRIPVFMRSRYQWNNNDHHGIVRKRVRVIILELMGIHAHCWNTVTGKKKNPGARGKKKRSLFYRTVLLITAQIKKKNRFENTSSIDLYNVDANDFFFSLSFFFLFYIDERCN